MKTAVILASGKGSKMWPYSTIRPKVMVPVANRPLISYNVDALEKRGFNHIIIIAGSMGEQIRNYFSQREGITVVTDDHTGRGTAFSLLSARDHISEDKFLVFYGDTIIDGDDMDSFIRAAKENDVCVLAQRINPDSQGEFICLSSEDNHLKGVGGHPRGGYDSRFCAFGFNKSCFKYFENNSGIFTSVNVGVMPPLEGYLEMSVLDYHNFGGRVFTLYAENAFIDMDKPWHILEANRYMADYLCSGLTENLLAEGSYIDPDADIQGFVKLGKNSRIGKRVVIKGNFIAGDNTIVDNGAILGGNVVAGNNCTIANYCQVGGSSVIGDRCIVEHCAEFSGVLFERVHLYHYMEYWGVIGACTDLGAATVCGTLRFDDGRTSHSVNGRREIPVNYSNACYLGDYSRTGVNAILMPGCKTGAYSIVGPGVILNGDLPDNTMVTVEQSLNKKQWGPNRYGW